MIDWDDMETADNSSIIEKTADIDNSALSKLDTYWDEVEKMPVPGEMPDIDLDEFSESHRIDMFHLARDAWEQTYDPEKLLSSLRSGYTSSKERKDLKDLRKHGLILRAGYKSLDGRHLAPQNHWLFLRLLGELNDGYYLPHRDESKEKLAEFVEKHYMSLEGLDFFPASDQSFQSNYKKEVAQVYELNSQDVLPAPEFHSMRKLLRNSMNIFRLSGTLTRSPEMTQRARYMHHLNETLGSTQDHLVQQDLQGEMAYGDALVGIPQNVRNKVEGFIAANRQI
jgi:hypothetical protein